MILYQRLLEVLKQLFCEPTPANLPNEKGQRLSVGLFFDRNLRPLTR